METSTLKKISHRLLVAAILAQAGQTLAAQPAIFDWRSFVSSTNPVITPVPHAEDYADDWRTFFNGQHAAGKPIAVMMKWRTGPCNGGTKIGSLQTIMDYVHNNGYKLDYVFADFEPVSSGGYTRAMADCDSATMVTDVHAYADANVSQAYVGNYNDYASCTDYTQNQNVPDRSDRCAVYLNSGLNISMPQMYQNSSDLNHYSLSYKFGSNLTVSVPSALFWAPLERLSAAKRDLPTGHKLIPWIGGYIAYANYPAPAPSQAETRALLQHARLRGADGYYTLVDPLNPNYSSEAQLRDDLSDNAWLPLDWFFNVPGASAVLNTATNKTGGAEWSGVRRGNRALFKFSNYNTTAYPVSLGGIAGMPVSSFSIPANASAGGPGAHVLMDYVLSPRSRWKLDENSGTAAGNQIAGQPVGTIAGATWSSGIHGSALTFNGNNDGIAFGDVLDLGKGDRSISLWFKTAAISSNYQMLVSKGYAGATNQHTLAMINGKVYAVLDITGTDHIVHSTSTLNDNQWHQVALTIDRADKMKLYVDGILNAQTDISDVQGTDAQDSYGFYVGRSHFGEYFTGSIDDVQVIDGVLSEDAVYDEYAAVMNLHLDDGGATAVDTSAEPHNGTVTGATWTESKAAFGSALTFNGTSDGVSFGDVLDLGLGDRSISLWFKTSATSANYQTLLSKGYGGATNQHTLALINGKVYAVMDLSGTDYILQSAGTLNDGQWHHVALTIDRADKMKLYVDNALAGQTSIAAEAGTNAQDIYGFYLGRSNIGEYYDGSIDEVRVYNKVLNAGQIDKLYHSVR